MCRLFVVGGIFAVNGDEFYPDYTSIIVASSVVGAVAFLTLIFLFQFVR